MRLNSFCAVALIAVFASPLLARADNLIGLGLGANFSGFTNEDSSTSNNSEFAATLFADWGLADTFYLETALRYTSYGLSESAGNINISEDAHYLEIPILAKPTFDLGTVRPYLLAGPVVGFKVGEGASANVNGQSVSVSTSIFKTVNFSGDFGAGVEVPVAANIRGFVQFDYELGFVNVVNDTTAGSAHTRGAVISAGAAMVF